MVPYVLDPNDCSRLDPFDGVAMRVTEASRMTLSVVEMRPHSVIPEHSHPHEQVGYLIEGEAVLTVDGQSYPVRAGQMWRLPGGVPHKVTTGEKPMRAVDVFSPVREDMRRSKDQP